MRRLLWTGLMWVCPASVGCAEGVSEPKPDGAVSTTDSGQENVPDGADGSDAGSGTGSGLDSGSRADTGGEGSGAGDGGEAGGTDGGGASDGGDDGDVPPPPPPALPVEGGWTLASQSLGSDPCGVTNYQDPSEFVASAYVVSHVDDQTFALSADGEAPGNCDVVEGAAFSCAAAQLRQDLSGYGIRAEMVVDTQFTGILTDEYRTMMGSTEVEVTCDGDCWLLELVLSFPCPMVIDMQLTAD